MRTLRALYAYNLMRSSPPKHWIGGPMHAFRHFYLANHIILITSTRRSLVRYSCAPRQRRARQAMKDAQRRFARHPARHRQELLLCPPQTAPCARVAADFPLGSCGACPATLAVACPGASGSPLQSCRGWAAVARPSVAAPSGPFRSVLEAN